MLWNMAMLFCTISILIGAVKDYIELKIEDRDNQIDINHSIEVEIVPILSEDISGQNIMYPNSKTIAYEIYFINNNISDVNISDIHYVIGNDSGTSNTYILHDEYVSDTSDSITIKAGENYQITKTISLGSIPYDQIKNAFPGENKEKEWIDVYDGFLKDKYGKDENAANNSLMIDARTVCVYYTLDYDMSKHMEKFDISYTGIDDKNTLKDKISIEEAFLVTKESYIGE